MAFNVYDFRSSLQFDGARPNLFEVNINFPGFLGEDAARRQLTFLCKSAQLPGSIISPIQLFQSEKRFRALDECFEQSPNKPSQSCRRNAKRLHC
jgi:hypothetical protein